MFFAPFYAGGVGVFDPTDDTFTMVDISGTITTGGKFQGAAYVPGTRRDGRVVFAPHNAGGVGVFDPTDDTFTMVDISGTITTGGKFQGAAYVPGTRRDGRVVFAPHNADGVGVFDPADDSFALFDISDAIDTNYKFVGAATADDGRVVFVPHHYYTFGVGVFTLPPRANDYASVPTSVFCDGQGPADRMGFDMGCPAYAIPYALNSESNPATECVDILDQYPSAPDAPYWFKHRVTYVVARKWCAFGGPMGVRYVSRVSQIPPTVYGPSLTV